MSQNSSELAFEMRKFSLYLKCGFQVYGVDPQVIAANNRFYDELLMIRHL